MKNVLTPTNPTGVQALTFESVMAATPDDYSLLEALANEQAGGYCTTLEFAGESRNKVTGQNELEWFVTLPSFTGGWNRDEDGYSRESQAVAESITVAVRPHMTLGDIADALTEAIKDIENNVFA